MYPPFLINRLPLVKRLKRVCQRPVACACLLLLCSLPNLLFADTLQLDIQGIDGELLSNVRAYLALAKLQPDAPISATRIKRLFKQAEQQTRKALQPLGYYRPEISTELKELEGGKRWQVLIRVAPKEAIRLTRVDLEILGEAQNDAEFQALMRDLPLQQGDILRHDLYEKSKKGLRDLAEIRGYFDAQWLQSRVEVNPETYQAAAFLRFDAGLRYRFGKLSFKQERFAERFLRGFVGFKPGDWYHNEVLRALQTHLSSSDYFDTIEVNTQHRHTEQQAFVDIEVKLTPKRQRGYRARVGYGTDTGLRVALDMQFRYLNRWGHRLVPNIGWTQNRNRHLADIRYLIPIGHYQENYFASTLAYQAEDFDSGDISLSDDDANSGTGVDGSTRVIDLSLTFSKHHPRRWLGQRLQETWSLTYLQESYELLPLLFTPEEQDFLAQLEASNIENINLQPLRPDYSVLYAGLSWLYQRSDDRVYANSGEQLRLSLKGARQALGASVDFWQVRLDSRLIRRVHPSGRLIFRSDLAYTDAHTLSVLDTFQSNDLPKALQFRTGGDLSVRGYRFEEIDGGAQTLVSGKHLVAASLEYEYRFLEQWSLGVFYDTGNVFNHFDTVKLKQGVGLGVRWHSPVGLVRLDFAYALDKEEAPFRIHLNIGPDF